MKACPWCVQTASAVNQNKKVPEQLPCVWPGHLEAACMAHPDKLYTHMSLNCSEPIISMPAVLASLDGGWTQAHCRSPTCRSSQWACTGNARNLVQVVVKRSIGEPQHTLEDASACTLSVHGRPCMQTPHEPDLLCHRTYLLCCHLVRRSLSLDRISSSLCKGMPLI